MKSELFQAQTSKTKQRIFQLQTDILYWAVSSIT